MQDNDERRIIKEDLDKSLTHIRPEPQGNPPAERPTSENSNQTTPEPQSNTEKSPQQE